MASGKKRRCARGASTALVTQKGYSTASREGHGFSTGGRTWQTSVLCVLTAFLRRHRLGGRASPAQMQTRIRYNQPMVLSLMQEGQGLLPRWSVRRRRSE
jgi:hypothetical protein